jgi:uncharacterized protein (TIGR03435 family)
MTNRHEIPMNLGEKSVVAAVAVALLALHFGTAVSRTEAQTTATVIASPQFEVASVKPSPARGFQPTEERNRGWGDVTGRVNLRYIPLKLVLLRAFSVEANQLTGPDWINTEPYDIQAIVPAETAKGQIPLMFQTLMAERFKLRFHRETRDTSVYALVVGEGGPKLEEVSSDDAGAPVIPRQTFAGGTITGVGPGPSGKVSYTMDNSRNLLHVEYARITMAELAKALSGGQVDLPVVDMTGLKGFYQLALDGHISRLAISNQATDQSVPIASDPSGDPVRESLKKVGLRLVRRSIPMERVVIDHIEMQPTEN